MKMKISGLKKIFLPAVLAVLAMIATVQTASASVYTWSRHNLTFEVPNGGFVTYSSNTRFEIRWDEMSITIDLFSKKDVKDKDIRQNLKKLARSYNMYDTNEASPKAKEFKVFQVEGTMPDGSRGLLTDMVSKKSDLLIEVTVNYLYGSREVVDEFISSFTEDPKTAKKLKEHHDHKQKVQRKEDADKQQKERENAEKHKNEKVFEV